MVQPSGERAFIPTPLPPTSPISVDGEMKNLLSKADCVLGRLDGSIRTLPNPDLFVFMYVRKEAVLSSQIEGTQSSLNTLVQAEAEIFDIDKPSDVNEVLNNVRAMNYGIQRIDSQPLSIDRRDLSARFMNNSWQMQETANVNLVSFVPFIHVNPLSAA